MYTVFFVSVIGPIHKEPYEFAFHKLLNGPSDGYVFTEGYKIKESDIVYIKSGYPQSNHYYDTRHYTITQIRFMDEGVERVVSIENNRSQQVRIFNLLRRTEGLRKSAYSRAAYLRNTRSGTIHRVLSAGPKSGLHTTCCGLVTVTPEDPGYFEPVDLTDNHVNCAKCRDTYAYEILKNAVFVPPKPPPITEKDVENYLTNSKNYSHEFKVVVSRNGSGADPDHYEVHSPLLKMDTDDQWAVGEFFPDYEEFLMDEDGKFMENNEREVSVREVRLGKKVAKMDIVHEPVFKMVKGG